MDSVPFRAAVIGVYWHFPERHGVRSLQIRLPDLCVETHQAIRDFVESQSAIHGKLPLKNHMGLVTISHTQVS